MNSNNSVVVCALHIGHTNKLPKPKQGGESAAELPPAAITEHFPTLRALKPLICISNCSHKAKVLFQYYASD